MTEKMPTYEELRAGGFGRAHRGFSDAVRRMAPGDVIEMPLNGRTPAKAQTSNSGILKRIGKETGKRYSSRRSDGRLFVICLRPEDYKNGDAK